MTQARPSRVLYAVICGAGPAKRIAELVKHAQARDWEVHCVATPTAVEHFLDVLALQELSGQLVRSTYRAPGDESHRTARELYRASELLATAGAHDHARHLHHTLRTTLR